MNGQQKPIPACMGGWCALRDHCPAYHAAERDFPSERLCIPGHDGTSAIVELIFRPRETNAQRIPSQQVGA